MTPALAASSADRPLFGLPEDAVHAVVSSALTSSTSAWAASESDAQARLAHFVRGGHAATADRSLADTAADGSSKLSVPLALGCVSPRQVHTAAVAAGEGAGWLSSHMEMRDAFVYAALAAGPALFRREGWLPVRESGGAAGNASGGAAGKASGGAASAGQVTWKQPAEASGSWVRWATGSTGLPLVDAAMRELSATGYCSNRVRQNAASLLTKDLGVDWRAGAEWFQWCLVDHEVAANWGNWAYFAGVGSDPKSRHFCTVSQAAKYDPGCAYVRSWVKELEGCDDEAALRPHAYAVAGWPEPLVDPTTQLTWHDAQALEESGRVLGH